MGRFSARGQSLAAHGLNWRRRPDGAVHPRQREGLGDSLVLVLCQLRMTSTIFSVVLATRGFDMVRSIIVKPAAVLRRGAAAPMVMPNDGITPPAI